LKYFKPIKIKSTEHINRAVNIINSDDDFSFKRWGYVNFKRQFAESQRDEAFEWAVGESGVYTNYLKLAANKLDTHIKPLVGADFERCRDGYWRIHLHSILRAKKRLYYDVTHGLWKFRKYGQHDHTQYKPSLGGVAYILKGHSLVLWQHYACPHSRQMCRGAKGCLYARRGDNDLKLHLSRATSTYRHGDARSERDNSQNPPCSFTSYSSVPTFNNPLTTGKGQLA
jgi:hypothetical protein